MKLFYLRFLVIFLLPSWVLLAQTNGSNAQPITPHYDGFKIPKKMSLEFGYRVIPSGWFTSSTKNSSNSYGQAVFPNQPMNALVARAEYAWQLAGFSSNRPAVYFGLPINVGFMFDEKRPPFSTSTIVTNGSEYKGSINLFLSYGFCIRHDLLPKDRPFIPFLAYELLVNQVFLEGSLGKILGHETRFDFGFELREKSHVGFICQFFGAYTSFGELGRFEQFHQFTLGLTAGISFH